LIGSIFLFHGSNDDTIMGHDDSGFVWIFKRSFSVDIHLNFSPCINF